MSLDDLYRHAWAALAPDGFTELDEGEPPRAPSWIFGLLEDLDLGSGARILDLACGPGDQAIELARRHGAHVIGVDPVPAQLLAARRAAAAAGERVTVVAATMERVPIAPSSIDLVWLRDALLHSSEPEATLRGCFRALRPGGHMLLHTAYATELLAPHELSRLEEDMLVRPQSLDARRVDAAVAEAGFVTVRSETLGSELAEHYEREDGLGSRALLRLARLNRSAELRRRLGTERARVARGIYHWVVFELLGKLSYRTTLLRRAE